LTSWPKSQHTAASEIDRKIDVRGRSMAFAFGGAGALLKAFVPTFPGLRPYRNSAAGARDAASAARSAPCPAALSAEAEAALAPLGLPPDGPIDPDAAPRARLAPDVAARNFVRWAQALDLAGDYATRSIYALYCEFSEVDGRPPLRDIRFLEALATTQGIATVARGKDKGRRSWRWSIAPAQRADAAASATEPDVDVWTHEPAPAPRASASTDTPASAPHHASSNPVSMSHGAPDDAPMPHHAPDDAPVSLLAPDNIVAPAVSQAPASVAEASAHADAPVPAPPASASPVAPTVTRRPRAGAAKPAAPGASQASTADAPASPPDPPIEAPALVAGASATAKAAKSSVIVLPRFVVDAEHPFSPAGLRERQKSARRLRLNAAASRKQRGHLRRAA
jgi:hypothetical protein